MPSVPDLEELPPDLQKRCDDALCALEKQVAGFDDSDLLQARVVSWMSPIHDKILNESI